MEATNRDQNVSLLFVRVRKGVRDKNLMKTLTHTHTITNETSTVHEWIHIGWFDFVWQMHKLESTTTTNERQKKHLRCLKSHISFISSRWNEWRESGEGRNRRARGGELEKRGTKKDAVVDRTDEMREVRMIVIIYSTFEAEEVCAVPIERNKINSNTR